MRHLLKPPVITIVFIISWVMLLDAFYQPSPTVLTCTNLKEVN